MFQSIKIRNFRSCADISLSNLDHLVVLVGRNGAGKTNIMKAIDWASKAATSTVNDNFSGQFWIQIPEVELIFKIGNELFHYWVKLGYQIGDRQTDGKMVRIFEEVMDRCGPTGMEPLFKRAGEKLTLFSSPGEPTNRTLDIAATAPSMVAVLSLLSEGDPHRVICEQATRFLSAVRYYPLHNYDTEVQTSYVTTKAYKKALLTGFDGEVSALAVVLKIIHMSLSQSEKFSELKALLGADGLGVINDIRVQQYPPVTAEVESAEDERLFIIRFSPAAHKSGNSFAFSDLSFGSKRILALMVAIVYDSSAVCLVEQPEDGVHPGLLNKLTPLIKTYSELAQFFIASHSPAVLDRVLPEEVLMVSMTEGNTHARPLDADEGGAAAYYLKEDGPLSEFLRSIEED